MLYRKLGNTSEQIPAIGQGTWKFGEDKSSEKREIEALRFGIENGLTLIDTAEEYADGGAERVVGEAIRDVRKDVFLVSKVSAKNCSFDGIIRSAEGSLERLKTDYLDLYLQHWPSKQHDLAETMEGLAELVKRGLVKQIGVSNFTTELLEQAQHALGSTPLVCNQVAYHVNDRRIEESLLPYCQKNEITVMGYSPFGYAPKQFGMNGFPEKGSNQWEVLAGIAIKHNVSVHQVALNWILRQPQLITIPKAVSHQHIKDTLNVLNWHLDEEDLQQMEYAF